MVDRCVCYAHTFEEIKAEADRLGLTSAEQVKEALRCGQACGMCIPYIELMMRRSGQMKFSFETNEVSKASSAGL
jgi:bacterioferritin-associated ferredoxin